MPTTVPIPPWNAEGLLPPIDAANPTSANRAPYPVTLMDLVLRFATSPKRIAILSGFLRYRAALHTAGLTAGFQWIDGSFVENIEASVRGRAPTDVDVVTFFQLPASKTQADVIASAPHLFPETSADQDALKANYCVDAYSIHLGSSGERLVSRSAYWYSMWAHQRDTLKWKGFLQVDLSPSGDTLARSLLTPTPSGGTP